MAAKFDLTDMRLMVNIAKLENMTKAAEQSFLSLPAASNRIKNLEHQLGTRLLYRNTYGVTLTPSGMVFVKHATRILLQLEHLNEDIREFAAGTKGKIRVFANTTAMSEFMPSVLSRYLQQHPDVHVELKEQLSYKIIQSVSDGLADIGIVAGIDQDLTDHHRLIFIPYHREHLVCITPKHHPLNRFKRISFRKTLAYDYISLPEGSAIRQFLQKEAEELGLFLRSRVEVGGFEAICRMVAAQVGVAIVPETVAHRYADRNALNVIKLTDKWAVRQLYVCFQSIEHLPIFAQDLVELMKSDST